jgi:hypothetical protein
LPQSDGMCCRWVADRGWSPGRIRWFPWQSVQTAEPRRPDFLEAIPWTLSRYAAIIFSSGRSYLSSITRSSWHSRQTPTMLSRNVRAIGSCTLRMSCLPWQSPHPGTSRFPFARAIPWVLWAYDFAASVWHRPHETGDSLPCGALASTWHAVHAAFPWVDDRYAFPSTNSDRTVPSGIVISIVLSPWHSWQSPTVGPAFPAVAMPPTAAARSPAITNDRNGFISPPSAACSFPGSLLLRAVPAPRSPRVRAGARAPCGGGTASRRSR